MDNQELNTVIVKIKKMLDEKEYDKVVKICSDEEYIQNKDIEHFMIIALMRAEKYEEAYKKVNEFLEKGYSARLEGKKIILIDELYGHEEALKECDLVEYKKDSTVYYRKANILFELGRFDEVLEICEKCKDADGQYKDMFLTLKSKVNEKIKELNKDKTPEALLLTKISLGKIDSKEIQSASIEKWKKDLLMVAYYDKMFNQKQAFFWAKQLRKDIYAEFPNDFVKQEIVSLVYDKFMERRYRPFGIKFFEEQLDCKVNEEYAEELRNKKHDKKEKPKKQEVKEEVKKEVKEEKKVEEKKIVGCTGTSINRYNNPNSKNKNTSQDIDNNVENKNNDIKIEDYFPIEINAIKKYIYKYTGNEKYRESAIRAFDKFDILSQKSIKDKDALIKLSKILKEVYNVLDVETKTTREKLEKMIK